jgi:hypothetical protein
MGQLRIIIGTAALWHVGTSGLATAALASERNIVLHRLVLGWNVGYFLNRGEVKP